MKDNNLNSLRVTDDTGKTIGKITQKDIVKNSDELNDDFFLD